MMALVPHAGELLRQSCETERQEVGTHVVTVGLNRRYQCRAVGTARWCSQPKGAFSIDEVRLTIFRTRKNASSVNNTEKRTCDRGACPGKPALRYQGLVIEGCRLQCRRTRGRPQGPSRCAALGRRVLAAQAEESAVVPMAAATVGVSELPMCSLGR